jgi:predicted acylesterase/phospholipase RssA/CRP-like cAMP-binding protein
MQSMNRPESESEAHGADAAYVADGNGLAERFLRRCIRSGCEPVHLTEGETLVEQGAPGDSMYVLMEGRLGVHVGHPDGSETVIAVSEPGSAVGEMALLSGQPRAATVRAVTDAQLVRVTKEEFNRLAERHPQELADFARTIAVRFQRAQLVGVLNHLFGELDTNAFRRLEARLTWLQLSHGEALFHAGDPGDAMYIVVNGLLRVLVPGSDGEDRVLGEVGPGEVVGESSLLTGEAHSATAHAIRETNVVRLARADFEALLEQYPRLMIQITRTMIRRQWRTLKISPEERPRALTLALIPASQQVALTEFALRLAASMDELGPVLHLDSSGFDREFGKVGAAETAFGDPTNPILAGWMSEQETKYRYILYEAEPVWSSWTQRCVGQADRLLLVGQPDGDVMPGPVESAIATLGPTARVELVLMHPADATRPAGTARWLDRRRVHAHHHVRTDTPGHYQCLARRLSGQSIGLVLSGGAARGFAHLGVFRALEELGIQVDRVGGTSMGALLGAGYAMGRSYEEMFQLAERLANPKQLFDYTLPYASVMASRKVTRVTEEVFEGLHIEDLWRPFFCVSTNLTQAEAVVHQTGPLWKSVRASIAIPGIFSPIQQEGDVLVDGGAMNNFPADIMRGLCEGGTVIGVNVSPAQEMSTRYEFGPSISGWKVLWSRINPLAERIEVPNLFANLVRALRINSTQQTKSMPGLTDLLIEPDVKEFASLDFGAYQPIAEVGYQEALGQLAGWQARPVLAQ